MTVLVHASLSVINSSAVVVVIDAVFVRTVPCTTAVESVPVTQIRPLRERLSGSVSVQVMTDPAWTAVTGRDEL
jgi:hypothetical protein